MKELYIFVLLVFLPTCLLAQQRTEYNRKGDEAMKRLDYSDARMWYEEGVVQCDRYSINQLTKIWQKNEQMRISMRSLMNKCQNCLNVMANEGDTIAISQLIIYYTEGIGTPKSEELASFWKDQLEKLRKPVELTNYMALEPERVKRTREPMKFFVGYTYSIEAPYGITVGGVVNRLGWYARFKTNMSFNNYDGKCRGVGELITFPENASFNFTNAKKVNSYGVTAGMIVKCMPGLYTTIGLGYGKRDLICEYITTDLNNSNSHNAYWCKNIDYSYNGLSADFDVMIKLGPVFVSAGCNTLNFKYIDLNAGLGVFF